MVSGSKRELESSTAEGGGAMEAEEGVKATFAV